MRNLLLATLSLLTLAGCDAESPDSERANSLPPTAPPLQNCAADDATYLAAFENRALQVQRDDEPGPMATPFWTARNAARDAAAVLNNGACETNTQFFFGAGIKDVTGPPSNEELLGYADPEQISTGIHTRQFARAFVFNSSCAARNSHALFISIDQGLMFHSIRQGVLDCLAQDATNCVMDTLPSATLQNFYDNNNVMISVTHSHASAAGQAHHDLANVFAQGHDEQSYKAMITGTVRAIEQAHNNLQTSINNNEPGQIRINMGELFHGNVQRSAPAYEKNPAAERAQYADAAGNEISTNRLMTLLRLDRDNGTEVGLLNWYAIHGTSISQLNTLLSGDNKGYAEQFFEKAKGIDRSQNETFIAAFVQADEGDNSPNIFIPEVSEADLRDRNSVAFQARGGGDDDFDNAAISGTKQLVKARELYDNASETVSGEIASAFIWIDMSDVTIDNPRTVEAEFETDNPRRTCLPAMGVSFGGGAEDGRGPSAEGGNCPDGFDQAAAQDFLTSSFADGSNGALPPAFITPVGCNHALLTPAGLGQGDYECQEEKPILFPLAVSPFDPTGVPPQGLAPNILPFQIIVIGNLAIIGMPWEVTTMSGHRIRNAVLDELEGAGVDYAVIAGLTNSDARYLVTREEYRPQQYEGASTIYGPWTQDAAQQEMARLASNLRTLTTPTSPYEEPNGLRTRVTSLVHQVSPNDGSSGGAAGTVSIEPDASYEIATGLIVEATFVAGDPRNDMLDKLDSSYLFIEQETSTGVWQTVLTDDDWQTRYHFQAASPQAGSPQSTVRIEWHVQPGTAPGNYRIRHEGATGGGAYSGTTQTFALTPCTG